MNIDERVHVSLKQLVKLQHQARGFSFLPKQPVGSRLMGRNRSNVRGRGLDFVELRDYRLGDDIRAMDWRVTNRTGKPHVRVYAEEKDHPVLLVVDQRRNMFFGSRWKMKSVIAAELAALIAWRTLAVGDRVGFIIFNDEEIIEFTPTRSKVKLQQYLAKLAHINQQLSIDTKSQHSIALSQVAKKLSSLMNHDYLAILFSDFIDLNEEFSRNLTQSCAHNDIIAAHIIDEAEKDLTNLDQVIVTEGKYQFKIDLDEESFQHNYASLFAKEEQRIKAIWQKNNIISLAINTYEAVDSQMYAMLGSLGVKGGIK